MLKHTIYTTHKVRIYEKPANNNNNNNNSVLLRTIQNTFGSFPVTTLTVLSTYCVYGFPARNQASAPHVVKIPAHTTHNPSLKCILLFTFKMVLGPTLINRQEKVYDMSNSV